MVNSDKNQVGQLDGTPDKRLFWSIISDYDLATALCELIDNAVDLWWPNASTKTLRVSLDLDVERQLISVLDDAGGVAPENLRYLIAPGGSSNDPDAETIGVFGVGSKRAAVALAEQISIRTQQAGNDAAQIDITKDWIASPSWDMPVFEVVSGPENSTHVSLSALRRPLTSLLVKELKEHLAGVYGHFLATEKFKLLVNEVEIKPAQFDNWAFPKDHEPRRVKFVIPMGADGTVRASITSGLIHDRVAAAENYGVYFYFNGRLIAKHLKVREVGYFVGSEAGVPHPDASLARTIVRLDGPAKLMPWTSNKTAVNYSHPVFVALLSSLLPLVSHFSSLSRRLKAYWESDVFPSKVGEIVESTTSESGAARVHLPALPRVNKSHVEQLVSRNRKTIDEQPWTLGLVEAVAAIDLLARQRFQSKNRISLILLDSNFEIALKEFIVHREDLFPKGEFGDAVLKRLFQNRQDVIDAITQKVGIDAGLLSRARHYYASRNKFVHERATVDVLDADITNYRMVIQQILQILFGLYVGKE